MRKPIHIVKQSDVRPARPDGTCFYCSEPLGKQHNVGCVIRRRTVIVEVRTQLLLSVDESWDEHTINFYMNESSSCCNNLIDRIVEQKERLDEVDCCMCNLVESSFIREATHEDEERFTVEQDE